MVAAALREAPERCPVLTRESVNFWKCQTSVQMWDFWPAMRGAACRLGHALTAQFRKWEMVSLRRRSGARSEGLFLARRRVGISTRRSKASPRLGGWC